MTERLRPLKVEGRTVHQVWMPYHWGSGGMVTGDSTNDLFGITLDPNVLIQETKVGTCDVRAGRRPSGTALREYVEGYARRAGVTDHVYPPIVTVPDGDTVSDDPRAPEAPDDPRAPEEDE